MRSRDLARVLEFMRLTAQELLCVMLMRSRDLEVKRSTALGFRRSRDVEFMRSRGQEIQTSRDLEI